MRRPDIRQSSSLAFVRQLADQHDPGDRQHQDHDKPHQRGGPPRCIVRLAPRLSIALVPRLRRNRRPAMLARLAARTRPPAQQAAAFARITTALRCGAIPRREADRHARSSVPLRPRGGATDRRRPAPRRGLGHRLPRTDRRARACGRRLAISRSRGGARRGAAVRCVGPERPAARHPDRGQGPDRHRRHADRVRLGDLCAAIARRRRRLRRAGARAPARS